MDKYKIEKEYTLTFPVRTVYEAWVSEKTIVPPATKLKIDPKVGGVYQLESNFNGMTWIMTGTFKNVTLYQYLKYSWEWNNDGEVSEVEVRFRETGAHTTVSVTHRKLPNEDSMKAHIEGWDRYIEGLGRFLD